MQSLEELVRHFAKRVKHDCAEEISRNPAAFKKLVVKLVRRELPPRPGRPNDPRLDAAAHMVQQGKSVKDVLSSQIVGFERLDTYGRYLAEKGLRSALARRRRLQAKSSVADS